MSDSTSTSATPASRSDMARQIDQSMSAIWLRRDGVKPNAVRTEYEGDVVRCVIVPGESSEEGGSSGADASTSSLACQHEVQAMVSQVTKRAVVGFVAKSDPDTGDARNSIILEPPQVKR